MEALKFSGNPSTVTASRAIRRHRSSILSIRNPTYGNKRLFPLSLTITRCATTKSGETGQDSHSDCLSTSSLPPSTRGLVLDLGLSTDSWDSEEIGSPVVKRFLSDNEERWYMWYHGSSKQNPVSNSVGLAVSNNGIHWERGKGKVESNDDVGLVMRCCEDWWAFDTASVRPGEVVIMSSSKVRANSSVYWMYYTGYTTETVDMQMLDRLRYEAGISVSRKSMIHSTVQMIRSLQESDPIVARITQDARTTILYLIYLISSPLHCILNQLLLNSRFLVLCRRIFLQQLDQDPQELHRVGQLSDQTVLEPARARARVIFLFSSVFVTRKKGKQ